MFLVTVLRATWCTVILISLQLSWKQEYWVHPRTIHGCYRSPIVDVTSKGKSKEEPYELCRLRCGRGFKKLAGVKSSTCYCDSSFGTSRNTLIFREGKNQKCDGDGKIWVMNSFVPPLPGCFGDDRSRDMVRLIDSTVNTNDMCRKLCGSYSYSFAGTQNGDECWCGNRYGSHSRKPDEECDVPCPGNPKEFCGGVWRNWVSVSAPVPDISCLSDQYGIGYEGKMSWAAFGQQCVKWNDIYIGLALQKIVAYFIGKQGNTLDIVAKTFDDFNRMSSSDKNSNYCRNIDRDTKGPWCFTDKKEATWDYCVIPICPNTEKSSEVEKITCKTTKSGQEYAGSKATTKDGLTCRGWSNTDVLQRLFKQPKMETSFDKFPPYVQMSNLCRNPNDSPDGPWCYIEGQFPKWDYCGIPFCKAYGSQTIEKFVGSHAIRLTPCAIAFTISTFSWVTIETLGRI